MCKQVICFLQFCSILQKSSNNILVVYGCLLVPFVVSCNPFSRLFYGPDTTGNFIHSFCLVYQTKKDAFKSGGFSVFREHFLDFCQEFLSLQRRSNGTLLMLRISYFHKVRIVSRITMNLLLRSGVLNYRVLHYKPAESRPI